jgi:hypothetical protein
MNLINKLKNKKNNANAQLNGAISSLVGLCHAFGMLAKQGAQIGCVDNAI